MIKKFLTLIKNVYAWLGVYWIIGTIALYFVCIGLYMFVDSSEFWDHFFWIVTLGVGILGLCYNFKKTKTTLDLKAIGFFAAYRALILLYYIIGLIIDKTVWMSTNIYNVIIFSVFCFVGFIFNKNK